MTASISTDILAILALCFTIYLAKRNKAINDYKSKIYMLLAVITTVLLLLEIATVLMEASSNTRLVVPGRIANIAGFSLCPVIPFLFLFFSGSTRKVNFYSKMIAAPLYFNALICILSYKTGWIFFIDTQNQYTRGKLFLLPTIVSMFYFVLMIIKSIGSGQEYDDDDKKVLVPIFFIPIVGTTIQLLFRNLLLIWGSTALSILMYYVFLRELQFKYDVQTEIRNRAAFEKEMGKYFNSDKNAIIVVADINNLKSTNDSYGHKAGDEMIYQTAKILEKSFADIGRTFRIGGDEFCVICRDAATMAADKALLNLDNLLAEINQSRENKIMLAYGYAVYNKKENEDIYSAFVQADKAMYFNKVKAKNTSS